MLAELKSTRYPVEAALLVALAFFLPLLEAPKNLAWLGFSAAWLWNRAHARDFGGRWDLWDTLIAAWIASAYLVAAFAPIPHQEWKGATDVLRYGSILWMVKRGGYGTVELRRVLGAVVAATLLSLALGWWNYAGGRSDALQLKSVGHVNHSAIYLAIVFGLGAAWLFAHWRTWNPLPRLSAAIAFGAILISLVATASRGAVAAGFLLAMALAMAWWPRWRMPLYASAAAIVLSLSLAVTMDAELVAKHQRVSAQDDVLNARDRVWNMGFAAWERYPWFGVGISNYSIISMERVQEWRRLAGKPFDANRYAGTNHAHSLYVNTLAERGVVGALALAAVLLAWTTSLVRRRPLAQDSDLDWLLWGGALSGLVITATVGLVNTTLHHEHGILATLLLGLWLTRLPRQPRRAS
ncbi:MAG: O-antigen ligase family protein [Betaproteobacteria bacterium]